MSRLVDPTLCPDCRATLGSRGHLHGLRAEVTGPLAAELWQRMVAADRVVEQLRDALRPRRRRRRCPLHRPRPRTSAAGVPPAATPAPAPHQAAARPRRCRSCCSRWARCACSSPPSVFVAVAWSVLGLTGRTLVLLGVTGLLALAAVVVTRRSLRGAAETLLADRRRACSPLDLLGAQSAGLAGLDALDWRGTGALVGVTLFVSGLSGRAVGPAASPSAGCTAPRPSPSRSPARLCAPTPGSP